MIQLEFSIDRPVSSKARPSIHRLMSTVVLSVVGSLAPWPSRRFHTDIGYGRSAGPIAPTRGAIFRPKLRTCKSCWLWSAWPQNKREHRQCRTFPGPNPIWATVLSRTVHRWESYLWRCHRSAKILPNPNETHGIVEPISNQGNRASHKTRVSIDINPQDCCTCQNIDVGWEPKLELVFMSYIPFLFLYLYLYLYPYLYIYIYLTECFESINSFEPYLWRKWNHHQLVD